MKDKNKRALLQIQTSKKAKLSSRVKKSKVKVGQEKQVAKREMNFTKLKSLLKNLLSIFLLPLIFLSLKRKKFALFLKKSQKDMELDLKEFHHV